ncbi:MAG TPA: hypothetical protein VGY31_09630 [Terriglobia bacterium]|nr:hypothetical protein [Terriglobia bacterium]
MRVKKLVIIPVLAMTLAACGVAEWVKAAQEILPVVLPMVTNMVAAVSLLEGKTVSPTDLNTISQTANQVSADLNLVGQLVNQYQSSPSSTTLSKINYALVDVNTHLNALMPALHISDPATMQKISAISTLITSEVTSMEQILPIVSGSQAQAMSRVAAPLSAAQLKSRYDAIVTQPSTNTDVDAVFAKAVLK